MGRALCLMLLLKIWILSSLVNALLGCEMLSAFEMWKPQSSFFFLHPFLSILSLLCMGNKFCSLGGSGQENAANVSLEVVKSLPRLQERDQSRGGRFGGGGRGGFSSRFSGGRGGRGDGFSGRGNGRPSVRFGGRGRGGSRW